MGHEFTEKDKSLEMDDVCSIVSQRPVRALRTPSQNLDLLIKFLIWKIHIQVNAFGLVVFNIVINIPNSPIICPEGCLKLTYL